MTLVVMTSLKGDDEKGWKAYFVSPNHFFLFDFMEGVHTLLTTGRTLHNTRLKHT